MVTCQGLPQQGKAPTGGSLRSYTLGEALAQKGHEVIYSIPEICSDNSGDTSIDYRRYAHNVTDVHERIAEIKPDIVIFGNWGLVGQALECDIPTAVDVNGSLVLENFFRNRGRPILDDALEKIKAFTKVDLIIAGSTRQKMYLTAWCLMAGMNPDHISIEVVPFSLPPEIPDTAPSEEPLFVMAGYDWPWLDGRKAVEVVSGELERLGQGHLHIYTTHPPYTDILPHEDSSCDTSGNLEVDHLPRITRHDPVSFKELVGILSKSSVALDIWNPNLERELAFPTRTVVYLWSGLPVIASPNGELSALIDRYQAGWMVESHDHESLAGLVRKIVKNPKQLRQTRTNVRRLVANHLTWDKAIEPLNQFCRFPQRYRKPSPLLSKLNRMHNNQLTLEKKLNRAVDEKKIMGAIHRRPKGFAILVSPALIWLKLRRMVIGLPVLTYLFVLSSTGDFLHRLSRRWGKS